MSEESSLDLSERRDVRVLVVRIGALGDAIHAVPMVNRLRDARPDWKIDWLAGPAVEKFLRGQRSVDKFVVMPRSVRGICGAFQSLHGKYDVAIDTQGLIKSAVIARRAAARVVGRGLGQTREFPAAWLYTDKVIPGSEHVITQNLELLSPLGITTRTESGAWLVSYDLPVPSTPDWPLVHANPVLLNVGGGWWTKLWPRERFAALAHRIHDELAIPVGVVWGPGEEEDAQFVAENSPAELAPKTTFGELGACFAKARLLVASETGPLHLAAALGCPTVGLIGPTSSARNGAFGAGHVAVEPDLHCRPCYGRTCADFRCMPMISVADVFSAVRRALAMKG